MGSSCPGTTNPAAVLEGDWLLIFDEPGDAKGWEIVTTFDADGQLQEIAATGPAGETASLTVGDTTTSTVDGSAVTVTIPRAGGTVVYEGNLSDDENSIDGSLSRELELPSGNGLTLPGSDLTLNRIE